MSTPLASETNVNGSENDRRTLGYKRFLRAATWNLRSGINNDGSLELARQVLKDRRLDLLAIPEAGRGGTGCISLHTGEQLIWTGPTTGNPRNKGVALLCSPRAAKCMISKTFVSDRIILASFYMLGRLTMDAVAFYAPHSSHAVDVRQNFRQQLNSLRQQVIRNHFHLELGDANALVGSATPTTPNFGGALGPHGIGEQNLAGSQFLDDCMAAGLCVANTFFQHKRIHKHSLRMFDFQLLEEGEIRPYVYHNNDFVVVRRSFLSSVRDVRVYRGLNGSSQFSHSDHHLVVATIKLRLSAPRRSRPRRDHSVLATDSNARQSYQVAVNTKLAAHMESLPNGASGEVRYDSIVLYSRMPPTRRSQCYLPAYQHNPLLLLTYCDLLMERRRFSSVPHAMLHSCLALRRSTQPLDRNLAVSVQLPVKASSWIFTMRPAMVIRGRRGVS